MGIFEWLENTPLALWVGESLWAYPFMLSLHVVGLAIVVGIFSMLDLRLMGLFGGIRTSSFLSMFKLAWVGFIVNAVSGAALFTSQAVTFISSTPFLLKIGFVFCGAISAAIIQAKLRACSDEAGEDAVGNSTKVIAAVSFMIWIGAIVTGRLIAYL